MEGQKEVTLKLTKNQLETLISHFSEMFYEENFNEEGELINPEYADVLRQLYAASQNYGS